MGEEIIAPGRGPQIKFRRRREDIGVGFNVTLQGPESIEVTSIGGPSLHLDVAVKLACSMIEAGVPPADACDTAAPLAAKMINADNNRSRAAGE